LTAGGLRALRHAAASKRPPGPALLQQALSNAGVERAAQGRRPAAPALAASRAGIGQPEKRGLVFTNPTTRLKADDVERSLLPMTDAEIRAVEQVGGNPAQRLIVALAAVHAARPAAIRQLVLDDLDLPSGSRSSARAISSFICSATVSTSTASAATAFCTRR
jgi:hypothetical protein